MNVFYVFSFLINFVLPLAALQKYTESKEKRLQKDLFENYDPYIRPTRKDRTVVRVGLLFISYDYNERVGELEIQGFMRTSWIDNRLSWNAKKKDVVGFSPAPEYDIWTPYLIDIRNRGFDGEPIYHPHGKAEKNFNSVIQKTIVRSQGYVTSIRTYRLTVKCIPNFMKWPKDTITCEAFFGSEANQNLNLTTFEYFNGYILTTYVETAMEDWVIISKSESKLDLETPANGLDQIIKFTLVLQTSGNIFTSLLIFPGIGLAAITSTLLVLNYDNSIRLVTLGISFIIHTYVLQILAFHIPPSGVQPPYLVTYFCHSLTITGLILVETLAVKSISSITQMSKLAAGFLRYLEIFRVLDLLVILQPQVSDENYSQGMQSLGSHGEDLTKVIVKEKSWVLLAFFIDRLMFISVILAYYFNILHFLLF